MTPEQDFERTRKEGTQKAWMVSVEIPVEAQDEREAANVLGQLLDEEIADRLAEKDIRVRPAVYGQDRLHFRWRLNDEGSVEYVQPELADYILRYFEEKGGLDKVDGEHLAEQDEKDGDAL